MEEIKQILIKNFKRILTCFAVCMSITAAVFFVLPKKYDATVVVRGATVGIVNLQSQSQSQSQGQGLPVESNVQTVARLGFPTFFNQAVVQACEPSVDSLTTAQALLSKSIKSSIVRQTTDLVQLTFSGESPEHAKTCLTAVIKRLDEAQGALSQARVKLLKDQLALRQNEFKSVKQTEDAMRKQVDRSGSATRAPAEVGLYLASLLSKRNQADELQRNIADYQAALSYPATQGAVAIEPVYVNHEKASFPKLSIFAILGLMFGAIASVVFCWRDIAPLLADNESVA